MMNAFTNLMTRSRRQMLKYPDILPAPLKAGRAFQMVDPLVSTTFDSGQTRWDRQFTDVPTATPMSFIFSDVQCQAFEAWYRDVLKDGALWFEMPLRSPVGMDYQDAHFIKAYAGPDRLGYDRWRISANILLRRRPLPDEGWGEFPEFLLGSAIIDRAINLEWPDSPFQTYMHTFDYAINEQWPDA